MSRLHDEESFLRDVANHEMTILRNDGLYRSIRFSAPKTMNQYFDVTTWPGYLCYSGDMGCYVFSRIPDMLEFFRHDSTRARGGTALFINPGYWGEKVEAIDRNSTIMEFDPEKFRRRINEWLDDCEAGPDLRRKVESEVLSRADDGEHEAIRAAMQFQFGNFQFHDFHEVNCREFSFRFLWCCYALAWAVRKWDGTAPTPGPASRAGTTS